MLESRAGSQKEEGVMAEGKGRGPFLGCCDAAGVMCDRHLHLFAKKHTSLWEKSHLRASENEMVTFEKNDGGV